MFDNFSQQNSPSPLPKELCSSKKSNEFVDCYTVFDVETTGLVPHQCEIIEVGALKVCHNEIVDTMSTFIKPTSAIPPFITSITGITNEMVADAECARVVLQQFLDFKGDDVILGHNVSFDMRFLTTHCSLSQLDLPTLSTLDTLTIARKYIKGVENYKLATLKSFLNLQEESHRALADCIVTHKLYQHCLTLING